MQPGDLKTASHIFFVVRDDGGHSDLLVQTSDTTWQAYNRYGGNSLYFGNPVGRSHTGQLQPPFDTRAHDPQSFVFNAEYPMVRWLEANGYNVSYTSGLDTDTSGSRILQHKIFLSSGHDEYWSGQRTNVEAARDAGVNLAFFSGNEMFWKTRWENSIDGTNTPYRTLVTYKETHANAKIDPTWRGRRHMARSTLQPAVRRQPAQNALTGTLFADRQSVRKSRSIVVSDLEGKMRFLAEHERRAPSGRRQPDLSKARSATSGTASRTTASVRPGLMHLSSATYSDPGKLKDYGAA